MGRFAQVVLVLLGLLAGPRLAAAAEDLDNCTPIASLPTTIASPGTYCMTHGFGVLMTFGAAINIVSDNVVLDCGGYLVDNDTAPASTTATGVASTDRRNLIVRRCQFEGFFRAVYLQGTGGGHVVEDNRVENTRFTGIQLEGDGSVARNNRVFNTGGSTVDPGAEGIGTHGEVDVLDNTIDGVVASGSGNGYGIVSSSAPAATIAGNRIRNVQRGGPSATAVGIWMLAHGRLAVRNNDIIGKSESGTFGLLCDSAQARARDNTISGWPTAMQLCGNAAGNVVRP